MKKVLFIVGPTAVGKTALALKIAQSISSVLISADSIQVYRGADIVSGKDHPKDVKIELVDILPPTESFNVRDFSDRVREIVNEESKRLPIIVGGTGLYTKSLFTNVETITIPQNKELRTKLDILSVEELQEKLKEINPDKLSQMNDSDVKNKRRLVRAIEIGSSISKSVEPVFKPEDVLMIGLETSMQELRERIKIRVMQRIEMDALAEVEKLFVDYDNLSPQLKVANGYKQIFQFLKKEITWDEAVEQWETADYQHAKAQMTWFKKDKNVVWFDIGDKDFEEKIIKLVYSNFT